MNDTLRYQPDGHAWLVIHAGEPRGWIVRELGGYAYLAKGFHGFGFRSASLDEVKAHLEECCSRDEMVRKLADE